MDIILIKIGGSIITDKTKPYTARERVIRDLGRQIKQYGKTNIVLSHGVGSFAHPSAQKYLRDTKVTSFGLAKVAQDASSINLIVMNELVNNLGLPAVTLHPMSMMKISNRIITKDMFVLVEDVLKQGVIPVVYGDIIWNGKKQFSIFSGEVTLNRIGLYLKKHKYTIQKVIQVGNTDGVYDKSGKTIEKITHKNWKEVQQFIQNPKGEDVTGGMKHKIEEALEMSKQGIKTVLVNGNRKNALIDTLNGKIQHTTTIL